jgi:hypothetical protein
MKLKLQIPDSLNDITLSDFQKFNKINTEENFNSVFLMQKKIEIFCKLDLNLTLNIKYKDLLEISNHIDDILNTDIDLIPIIKIDDIEYGFIPKLDDISLGEYIDLDNYLGNWDDMHKALAVLYRPLVYKKGERYLIEDYDGTKYSEIMQNSPLSLSIGAMVFFWNLNSELLNHTLNYLKSQLKTELNPMELQALEQNGVGINQSLHSLQEILRDLNISPS